MGHRGEWRMSYSEILESLKAESDTSGIILKNKKAENRIKAEKAIEKSAIKPLNVFIGLVIIWVLLGGAYIILKRKKGRNS
jgi:hypothetical protein